MRIRLGVVVATACILASSVATRAEPAVKPPANEDCLACHGDADAKRANGSPVFVADKVLAGSTHAPLWTATVISPRSPNILIPRNSRR